MLAANPKAKLADLANALILAFCEGVAGLSSARDVEKTGALMRYGEEVIQRLQLKAELAKGGRPPHSGAVAPRRRRIRTPLSVARSSIVPRAADNQSILNFCSDFSQLLASAKYPQVHNLCAPGCRRKIDILGRMIGPWLAYCSGSGGRQRHRER